MEFLAADWSSLPADLLNRIADRFLATSDVDYYMDFRAVCRRWRSTTQDPKNSPDPRFHPRHWVNINGASCRSNTRLLVNTATGRTLRQELGYLIRFMAQRPGELVEYAALESGSPPTIFFFCKDYMDDNWVIHESSRKVYMAQPDSESLAIYEDRCAFPLIRLAASGIYTIGGADLGSLTRRIFDLMRFYMADLAEISDNDYTIMSDEKSLWKLCVGRCFLTESAGKVLIIMKLAHGVVVYRLHTHNYKLEHVEDIGNCAIFLDLYCWCLCVNADKFPSVHANCVYYQKSRLAVANYMCMYNLKSEREERVDEKFEHLLLDQRLSRL
uniref:HTH Mu-type domain-containing protein n=2 Tax=Aegilops tauschii TaxID=37682 RepID=A0A453GSK3_AEGTS